MKTIFALATFFVLSTPIGITVTQLGLDRESWKSFDFYAVILDWALYTSAFTYIATYVTGLSFFIILPLLRITVGVFEDATESLDLVKLHVSTTRIRKNAAIRFRFC